MRDHSVDIKLLMENFTWKCEMGFFFVRLFERNYIRKM